jgi:ABC-type dipeptide/oligopeptide/nickel transport system permease component
MVTFFVRRLVGGALTFLASTFVLYSIFLSPSIGWYYKSECCDRCDYQQLQSMGWGTVVTYALDKPWPQNYLSWLYDPDSSIGQTFLLPEELCFGGVRPAKSVHFANKGLLTGDFGKSLVLAPDVFALDVYGIHLGPFYFISFIILLFPLFIALLQRRGRPYAWRSSRIPANARWRPAELWATG